MLLLYAVVCYAVGPMVVAPSVTSMAGSTASSFASTADGEYAHVAAKLLPVVGSVGGVLASLAVQVQVSTLRAWLRLGDHLGSRGYVDMSINHAVVAPVLGAADRVTCQVVDKGVIEAVGPAGSVMWQEWVRPIDEAHSGHVSSQLACVGGVSTGGQLRSSYS